MKPAAKCILFLSLSATLPAQFCEYVGSPLGSGDNVLYTSIPIGFAFPFKGATFTELHVSTNGYVKLGNPGQAASRRSC